MLAPGLLLSLRPSSSPQISVLLHGLLFTRYYPSIYTLLNALTDAPCRHFSHHPVPTFLDCYSPILSPLILPYFILSYSTPRNLRTVFLTHSSPDVSLPLLSSFNSNSNITSLCISPSYSFLHLYTILPGPNISPICRLFGCLFCSFSTIPISSLSLP